MKVIDSNELKRIQLKILDNVVDFCNDNNIRYFLAYGTLLGAIRHQGYIPWDDDIDIVMLREDYEKFIDKFNEYSDLYKVYTIKNTSWFPYPFAKVSYENSIMKELSDSMLKDIGINIDIFPIDSIPKDEKHKNKLLKQLQMLQNFLNVKSIVITSERDKYKNLILYLGKLVLKGYRAEEIVKKIDYMAKIYKSEYSQEVGNIVFGNIKKELISRNIFSDIIYLNFEGKKYLAPIGYHDWLTSIYGDYMQLPPEEERTSHHRFKAYLK